MLLFDAFPKGASFPVRAGLPGEFGDQVPRNEIANLTEDSVMSGGWTFFCFHTRRVAVNEESIQPFFSPLWDGCETITLSRAERRCFRKLAPEYRISRCLHWLDSVDVPPPTTE